jgi:hypothetical protein
MLTLRDPPNPRNEISWDYTGGTFIVWPADYGLNHVRVKIGVAALSDYIGGDGVGMLNGEIEAALVQHRDLIQRLAQAKYRRGSSAVTLDVGDFPARSKSG